MPKFQKKPIEIEAVRFDDSNQEEIIRWTQKKLV